MEINLYAKWVSDNNETGCWTKTMKTMLLLSSNIHKNYFTPFFLSIEEIYKCFKSSEEWNVNNNKMKQQQANQIFYFFCKQFGITIAFCVVVFFASFHRNKTTIFIETNKNHFFIKTMNAKFLIQWTVHFEISHKNYESQQEFILPVP